MAQRAHSPIKWMRKCTPFSIHPHFILVHSLAAAAWFTGRWRQHRNTILAPVVQSYPFNRVKMCANKWFVCSSRISGTASLHSHYLYPRAHLRSANDIYNILKAVSRHFAIGLGVTIFHDEFVMHHSRSQTIVDSFASNECSRILINWTADGNESSSVAKTL